MLHIKKILCIISIVFCTKFSFSQTTDAIIGVWKNQEGTANVEIYKQGNKYFGKIVWLSEPIDATTNKPKTDKNNSNEKLRTQPLMGLVLLRNFEFSKPGVWDDGKIYDPKNGKDYSCTIKMQGNNTLNVRGYIGFSLLGRTAIWTRQ